MVTSKKSKLIWLSFLGIIFVVVCALSAAEVVKWQNNPRSKPEPISNVDMVRHEPAADVASSPKRMVIRDTNLKCENPNPMNPNEGRVNTCAGDVVIADTSGKVSSVKLSE